jgi:hypothetical protein
MVFYFVSNVRVDDGACALKVLHSLLIKVKIADRPVVLTVPLPCETSQEFDSRGTYLRQHFLVAGPAIFLVAKRIQGSASIV